jgi:hypothetical protein
MKGKIKKLINFRNIIFVYLHLKKGIDSRRGCFQ